MPDWLLFRMNERTHAYDRVQRHEVMMLTRTEEENISKENLLLGFNVETLELNNFIGNGHGITCELPPILFKGINE